MSNNSTMGSGTSSSSFGRKSVDESSFMKGSEEYIETKYSCDLCKSNGDEIEAKGYCNVCKDYLCDACFKNHSSSSLSAHHALLDQSNMPKNGDKISPSQSLGADTKQNKVTTGSQQRQKDFVLHHKINVKASSDETDCFIERMTLVSKKELAILDFYNKSLKIVETDAKTIKRCLRFQTTPLGMTKISDNSVAITLPSACKIEIICTADNISVVQTLKTSGQCLGICYKSEKLYVSFLQKIQILRMNGAVQKTIQPCVDALKHLKHPSGLAVSPDEMSIFVSDWKSNKLMRISLDGTLLSIYQDELDSPKDILVSPSGSVYLLNSRQHFLYEVRPDLSEATVVLGAGDGLTFPNAMFFDELKQQFFISTGSSLGSLNNEIKVYDIK